MVIFPLKVVFFPLKMVIFPLKMVIFQGPDFQTQTWPQKTPETTPSRSREISRPGWRPISVTGSPATLACPGGDGFLGMDQYLLIPFLGGCLHPFASYFDVNYRGTIGFDAPPNIGQ